MKTITMNSLLLIAGVLLLLTSCSSGEKKAESEYPIIVTVDPFPSQQLRTAAVDICFPSNYSSWKKYNVLYLHDPETDPSAIVPFDTEWLSRQTLHVLYDSIGVKDCVLVWIRTFYPEQGEAEFPQKLTQMLADEVKPYVEKEFNIRRGKDAAYFAALDSELADLVNNNYSSQFAVTATQIFKDDHSHDADGKRMKFYFISDFGH